MQMVLACPFNNLMPRIALEIYGTRNKLRTLANLVVYHEVMLVNGHDVASPVETRSSRVLALVRPLTMKYDAHVTLVYDYYFCKQNKTILYCRTVSKLLPFCNVYKNYRNLYPIFFRCTYCSQSLSFRKSYLGVGVMRCVCGLECEGCDDNDCDDAIVVDDVVVTTGDRGVDNEIDDVGMALDDTANDQIDKCN